MIAKDASIEEEETKYSNNHRNTITKQTCYSVHGKYAMHDEIIIRCLH